MLVKWNIKQNCGRIICKLEEKKIGQNLLKSLNAVAKIKKKVKNWIKNFI